MHRTWLYRCSIEHEDSNNINFLDITISRENKKLNYKIYRKPAGTSTTIYNTSCHTREQKTAAFNYLCNRVNTYPLTGNNRKHKIIVIKEIAHKNVYRDVTAHKPQM
jgi:hypothetical protein